MKPPCSFDGCTKQVYARGYCESHYGKLMRNGTPDGSSVYIKKVCRIDGCSSFATRKGLCGKHYQRMKKYGDPAFNVRKVASKGEPFRFLCEEIQKETDECMTWPFGKISTGYGLMHYEGKVELVHRLVCKLVYGNPPFESAQAAHLCGNGHLACFNPKHLKWTDHSENQMHRVEHGTSNRGEAHGMSTRTETEILRLKDLILSGKTDTEIHRQTGENRRFVNMIRHGKVWGWLTGFGNEEEK